MPDFPRRKTQPTRPFSAALKEARSQAGLTQAKLAEMLGVTEDAVRSWELGRRQPPDVAPLTKSHVLDFLVKSHICK